MTSLTVTLKYMTSQIVTATEFKAKCLALLDEVATNGRTITVTKRGKPVATVSPAKKPRFRSSRGILKGKIFIPDDLETSDYTHLYDCINEKANFGL